MSRSKIDRYSLLLAISLHGALLLWGCYKSPTTKLKINGSIGASHRVISAFTVTQARFKQLSTSNLPAKNNSPDKSSAQVATNNFLQQQLMKHQVAELATLKSEHEHLTQQLKRQQKNELDHLLAQNLREEQLEQVTKFTATAGALAASPEQQNISAIGDAIASHWIKPAVLNAKDFVKIALNLAPDGTILRSTIIQSSNNTVLERTALAAIENAAPFATSELKNNRALQELIIVFRAGGISTE